MVIFIIAYYYSALSQDFKLLSYLCYKVVYLCVAHLFTMIMKAEILIYINSKKNEKRLVNKKIQEIRKGIKGLYKKGVETRLGHE